MKIGYKYYKVASKPLLEVAAKTLKAYKSTRKEWAKFAESVGADPKRMWVGSGGSERLLGVAFRSEELPDTKAWLHVEDCFWRPRGNGTRKDLYKEFRALPKWNSNDLEKAVGFKIIFHGGFAYFFSPAITKDGAMFRVPVFDIETKDNTYVPVKGVKEVSLKVFNAFVNT